MGEFAAVDWTRRCEIEALPAAFLVALRRDECRFWEKGKFLADFADYSDDADLAKSA